MTHQNPLISETPRSWEYEYKAARDARLHDEHRVGPFMIGLYFVGMIFAVFVVLWGLAHQREEPTETSATSEHAAPPSAPAQQPSQQQGTQGAQNPPAKQEQAQPKQPQQAQPLQNQGQQNQLPPAQQNQPQSAPAPKQ